MEISNGSSSCVIYDDMPQEDGNMTGATNMMVMSKLPLVNQDACIKAGAMTAYLGW